MARRQHITLMFALAIIAFLGLTYLLSSGRTNEFYEQAGPLGGSTREGGLTVDLGLSDNVLHGGAIAPKLENATAKAELGRAAWKLFHTTMARFPEKPTADDSLALKTYIHLFARLYPCGECAGHFQKLLEKYPPQVGSRNNAAGWACLVHNEVNKRLKKEQFPCDKIGDFYDCGCGDEDGKKKEGSAVEGAASGSDDGTIKIQENVSVEKEGLTRGG